jgi:hypothetical protein
MRLLLPACAGGARGLDVDAEIWIAGTESMDEFREEHV